MRKLVVASISAIASVLGLSGVQAQTPLGTAFTYQGELASAGTPATGTYDIRFRLYDAGSGGNQIGSTLCSDNSAVTAGRFATSLDFGAAAFAGQQRFLEIEVRQDTGLDCTDATGYTVLSPRQELTAAPNASFALNAATANTATTATNATSLNFQPASFFTNAANLTGTLPSAALSGTYTAPLTLNNSANFFTGNGAGITNLSATNIATGILSNARTSGTNLNTANTLVLRDATGNFSAGTITAALNGNATTATTAANATQLNGQAASFYTNASNINAGTLANARTTGTALSTPSTLVLRDASGNFSAGTITAALTGNATSATNATQLNGQAASFYTNASNITTGTLAAAQIPNLDASKITSGTLANARTTGTSLNAPDAIVLRDVSGNFSAGTITANLNGNATTATSATTATTATNATQLNGQPATFYTSASNITAGTLAAARIPSLDASILTTGTIANARTTGTFNNTPNTLVLRDSTGVFAANLLGTATNATQLNGQPASFYTNASNITAGSLPPAQVPNIDASKITSGTIRSAVLPAFSWNAASLPVSNINPTVYITIPGTPDGWSMRAGVAVVNWSISGYATAANTVFGIRVRLGSNTGPVTNFYYNAVAHAVISGNAIIPIPTAGIYSGSLEVIRVSGGGNFATDGNDSLTATVINLGQ